MAAANPLWGAPRIHAELLKLGITVAERTVSRLLPTRRRPPSQTWRTFLANHVRDLVGLHFFTVPTASLRVLFVLVVLAHDRRRVVHFNVTECPTAAWTAQQIADTFPDDPAPAYLLRDRDPVYGERFRQRMKGMRIGEVLTAPHSLWQDQPEPAAWIVAPPSAVGPRSMQASLLSHHCAVSGVRDLHVGKTPSLLMKS